MTSTPTPTPLERRLAGEEEAGVSPLDAFAAARRRFLRRERIDMQELAAELGISRATLYRWVGSRDQLLGEVIWSLGEIELARDRATVSQRGVEGFVEVYEHFLGATASNPAMRHLLETAPEAALRILTSKAGVVQRRLIDVTRGMLQELVDAGELEPRLDLDDLAYVLVRVGEAFSWTDFITGDEPDVSKAAEVVRVLLT